MIKIFCTILLLHFSANIVSSQKILGCYWGSWTTMSQINVSLCTHAYYAFYLPDSSGGIAPDAGLVSNFLALKSQNPSVKLIASIGGASAGTTAFSAIAASSSLTSKFVTNCVALTTSGYDGIDIDWEFPATSEQTAFVNLLAALKTALSAKGKILIAAVSSDPWQIPQSYNIPSVCNNLDLVNIMTYDMQWPYTVTGTNSGYGQSDSSIALWINGGCSASKVVLGLAAYGYDFTLKSSSSHGLNAAATGAVDIPYRDICSKLKASGWTTVIADQTPYAYKGTEWISYDDVTSLTAKMNIVSARGLPGAFFWSTDLDDYDNSCGTGNYPLFTAVAKALGVISSVSVTTKASVTTTTTKAAAATTTTKAAVATTTTIKVVTQAPTTTTKAVTTVPTTQAATSFTAAGTLVCSTDGFYAYPGNCNLFYRCFFGFVFIFSCPAGTGWSESMLTCVLKSSIPGCV